MPLSYPTREHERAAAAIMAFFAGRAETDVVLVTNSCARGKATPDSCLDMHILVPAGSPHREALERDWQGYAAASNEIAALRRAGKHSVVHLDITDGQFRPLADYDGSGGPDPFELEIGNAVVYAVPVWQRGDRMARLRAQWLPYYDEGLRRERLVAMRGWCVDHLEHIPPYVARGLYFQSFDRLYSAFALFLQCVFIARRTYPIAYNKWIHEQIVEILGLPELYAQLPGLLEIGRLESTELVDKARTMRDLLDAYAGV